ncbi:hypothetical protein G9A89_016203 [Geosiphon pyriformis]|nr:hypothetical protein G9A89_016203 [Geosiphon pyriformis]
MLFTFTSASRVQRVVFNSLRPNSSIIKNGVVKLWGTRLMSTWDDRAGSIRDSAGSFGKREKAVEEQYFRKHDAEKLKHLQEELKKQKKKLDELEDQVEDLVEGKSKE